MTVGPSGEIALDRYDESEPLLLGGYEKPDAAEIERWLRGSGIAGANVLLYVDRGKSGDSLLQPGRALPTCSGTRLRLNSASAALAAWGP